MRLQALGPLVAALVMALSPTPTLAAVSPEDIATLGATPPSNAALPLRLAFLDQAGHSVTLADAIAGTPTVVVFADYTCHTLCGPVLTFAATALEETGLSPGTDFRLVAIGLDPTDTPEQAHDMMAARIGARLAGAMVFLTGAADTITAAATALGYRYSFDADRDQFAHPVAAYVVDRRGRVIRALSAVGLSGADLRLALVDAGHGRVGTITDQIRLLCYGYDAVRGLYTQRITLLLRIAAAATGFALLGTIAALMWRDRRVAP
jgi:protein SCO1/2